MKKIKIMTLIFGFSILFAIVLYWRYTQTPKYSLLQIQKAIEQHDLTSFEKYVDIEGVISSLIDQILELTTRDEEQQNIEEKLGETIGKGIVILLKPQLTKILKQQISQYIETGKFQEQQKKQDVKNLGVSLLDFKKKFSGKNRFFQGVSYIKQEGKIAYIGLKFFYKEYNTSLILNLKMRNKGQYWQLAEISNFSEFMQKLDNLEAKRIAKLNKPIITKMKQTLVLKTIKKSSISDEWGFNKKIVFKLKFKNNGKKEIDEYKVVVICRTPDGTLLKKLFITDKDNIRPGHIGGGIWSADVNMFINNDNLLYKLPQSKLNINVDVQYIKFIDGDELKLYKNGSKI